MMWVEHCESLAELPRTLAEISSQWPCLKIKNIWLENVLMCVIVHKYVPVTSSKSTRNITIIFDAEGHMNIASLLR